MISSFPSYDEELLNSAYANISLIADKAWTFDKEDPFQKLNQLLWFQNHKLAAKYKENVAHRTKRVRDVIPDSRLAMYGNYEYSEERESMYKPDDNSCPVPLPNFCWTEVTEPWMLPEVEKYFAWLTSSGTRSNREFSATRIPESDDTSKIGCAYKPHWVDYYQSQQAQRLNTVDKKIRTSQESNRETSLIEFDPTDKSENCCELRRYTIENSLEMQLHVRLTSDAVRNLWKPGGNVQQSYNAQQKIRLQCYQLQPPREQSKQFYYAFQYRPLIVRTETYGMRKHLPPVLSPEVPEFFPKVPMTRFNSGKEQNANRLQYFPSLNERSYQHELFPYNRTHENAGAIYQSTAIPLLSATDATTFIRPTQQWYQRIPPPTQIQLSSSSSTPMCTSIQPLRAAAITHYPLQMQDKFLPSNQIPIPVYQHPVEIYHESGQKRKNQGVDFKNLILLTKNAMKAHRGQAKSTQQKASYVLDGNNRSSKSESEVIQWQNKSGTSRTKEFAIGNALVSEELRNIEGKADRRASSSRREKDNSKNSLKAEAHGSGAKGSCEREKNDTRNRRRLYRDVLTNASANQALLENVFEKRYDELEQQAMEQYRTSEESLALKYQELERQALEQYKCGSGGGGGGGNVQEDDGSSSRTLTDDKQSDETSAKTCTESNCLDGQKCCGFGKCSPVNTNEGEEDRDYSPPRQDNIAQDNKNDSPDTSRSLPEKNSRASVLSKSLTTLSQKLSYESKNTTRGASGDKIDKTVSVRASSKRRLILVSPFEKESEAKLTRSTDLEEFYCIAQANKNIFSYYNNSKVEQIGGGDENLTIIQSPRTEGKSSWTGMNLIGLYSINDAIVIRGIHVFKYYNKWL